MGGSLHLAEPVTAIRARWTLKTLSSFILTAAITGEINRVPSMDAQRELKPDVAPYPCLKRCRLIQGPDIDCFIGLETMIVHYVRIVKRVR